VIIHPGHLDFRSGEIEIRGDEGEVFDACGEDEFDGRSFTNEGRVDAWGSLLLA
jgi:hypothetical protein